MFGGARQKMYLRDAFDGEAEFTPHNALRVAFVERCAGGVFNDSLLDPNYATAVAANGTVTVSDGEIVLATTTDSGSSALLTTVDGATDATDATKIISVIDMNVSAPAVPIAFDVEFFEGLYVVVVGASTDITIKYE